MYKWLAALKHLVMMFQSDKCIAHVIPFCLRKHKSKENPSLTTFVLSNTMDC